MMIRNWRASPPPFRCYVEATTSRHKISVKHNQIEIFRNRSYIRFDALLKRLKDMETNEEINYGTHSFRVCSRRQRSTEIWNVNYRIEDQSKILAIPRSKRSIAMLLKLMDIIEQMLAQRSDSTPLNDSFWLTASQSMESSGYRDFGPNRAFKEFRTLVVEFENYLDHRLNCQKNHLSADSCSSIPVLFSRLESMRLKPFFFNMKKYQNLEQKKTELAVKETVDYLLIQTSIASCDFNHRPNFGGDQKDVKPEEKAVKRRKRSPKRKSKDLRRNEVIPRDADKFRPSFESEIDDFFDSALVEVILDLQTKSEQFYDWPTIRRMMVNRGFHAYGERYCKKRFKWLVNKLIWALEHLPSAKKATKDWPLFTAFMQLDLHPFVDHQTYKMTAQMKANFGRNRGVKSSTTSAYNRAKNWDNNYFNYYNYYHSLWSNMSRKYY